jgi:hypothetical protein
VFRAIAGSKPEECRIVSYIAGCVRKAYETMDDGSEMVKAERKL